MRSTRCLVRYRAGCVAATLIALLIARVCCCHPHSITYITRVCRCHPHSIITRVCRCHPHCTAHCYLLGCVAATLIPLRISLGCVAATLIPLLLGCVAATLIALLSFGCVAATLIACTSWGVLLPPLFYPRVHPTTFSPIYCQSLCILSCLHS